MLFKHILEFWWRSSAHPWFDSWMCPGRLSVPGAGELARCLEHESDHLRGELFIDKLKADERRRVMRQIRSQWPPTARD
jgi:Polypeptide deformylase